MQYSMVAMKFKYLIRSTNKWNLKKKVTEPASDDEILFVQRLGQHTYVRVSVVLRSC